MDYGNAFVYMFSSEDWIKKLILAVAMSLIPALGIFVVVGWALDVLRNLREGKPDPLPEWTGDEFARWLGRGMGLTVTVFTFLLPVIAVFIIIWSCGMIGTATVFSESDAGGTVALCMVCVYILMYFVAGLGALVAFVRYASTDRIDVGLEYSKNFQLVSTNIATLLIIVVLMLLMWIVAGIAGILTLGILYLALPVYSILVLANFGAQLSQQPDFSGERDIVSEM